jgi:hypothetical protein
LSTAAFHVREKTLTRSSGQLMYGHRGGFGDHGVPGIPGLVVLVVVLVLAMVATTV